MLVLVRRFVADTERQRGRFDVTGAITATVGSASLVFGFINAPDHGWTSAGTLVAFAVAAVLLGSFVAHERRTPHALLPLELLRNRTRAGAVIVMALFVGAQFAFFFFTVQFMHGVLGYGALRSGLAFLPLTLLIFATSRISPRLVQRFGVRPLIVTGTVLVGAANLWLAGIDQNSTYAVHLLGPMLLTGIGAGLTFMPITVAVLSDVEPRHAGSASGLLQMAQQVGGSLGLAVLVTVYASYAEPGNIVAGMQQSFEVGAVFLALALVVALVMLRRPRATVPDDAREVVDDAVELAAKGRSGARRRSPRAHRRRAPRLRGSGLRLGRCRGLVPEKPDQHWPGDPPELALLGPGAVEDGDFEVAGGMSRCPVSFWPSAAAARASASLRASPGV